MNRLACKVIWNLIMEYYHNEDSLYDKYPTRKAYVQAHYDITDNDYDNYWKLYLKWVGYDMEEENTGKIKVYDYIYNHWYDFTHNQVPYADFLNIDKPLNN